MSWLRGHRQLSFVHNGDECMGSRELQESVPLLHRSVDPRLESRCVWNSWFINFWSLVPLSHVQIQLCSWMFYGTYLLYDWFGTYALEVKAWVMLYCLWSPRESFLAPSIPRSTRLFSGCGIEFPSQPLMLPGHLLSASVSQISSALLL